MSNSAQREQPASSTAINAGSLGLWYQSYIAADGNYITMKSDIVQVVQSDELDDNEAERKVQQFMPATHVAQGFCAKCSYLLVHWPDLSGKDWACEVGRYLDTSEIEAATRMGCQFCAFLLCRLKTAGLLGTFRKLEARLHTLEVGGSASLSIQNWGGGQIRTQLLWLNFPGKVANNSSNPGASASSFESHIISPTSKPNTLLSCLGRY